MRLPFISPNYGGAAPPDGDVVVLPSEALAPPPSFADRLIGYLRAHWRSRYQPDRYYMRGKGPAWHANHPPDWAPPRRH